MTYFMEPMNSRRKPAQYRVLMNFMCRQGWHISFLNEDCRTTLPRKLTFSAPDKIIEIYERWGESHILEDRSSLEHAITQGRGAIWLKLTAEQYARLTK